jgi:hypothetical protein
MWIRNPAGIYINWTAGGALPTLVYTWSILYKGVTGGLTTFLSVVNIAKINDSQFKVILYAIYTVTDFFSPSG